MAKIVPIIREVEGSLSPLDLFEALKRFPYCFFLDSASMNRFLCQGSWRGHGGRLGRYSFLGCEPFLVFKSKRDVISMQWEDGATEVLKGNPFTLLKKIFKKYRLIMDEDIPLTSGGVGYFSYDLKDFNERLPDTASDDLELADSILGFYDVIIIYDHMRNKVYISSSGLPEQDIVKNRKRAEERLEYFVNKLSNIQDSCDDGSIPCAPLLRSNFSKTAYVKAVNKAKEYIKRGDIYQVNLSQRFEAELNTEPSKLYKRLRAVSPAPFSSYLDFKDVVILSSSPERFLSKRGDHIETRPIKGTRPRGQDFLSDISLERTLLASPKDRAEHIMIVDLERNDLGRICEYGSIKVDEFVELERYSTVFHLVSTVSGKLKKDTGPVDCLEATFPGGSITGAPKIRSMEIIEELEPFKRAVYTGAIGYISFSGDMDTSVVIRTFVIKNNRIYFQVGGGIVADSDPEKEYEETLDKAKGLMRSLGVENTKKDFALCPGAIA